MSVCLSIYMDLAVSGVYFLKISGVRSDSKRRDDGRVLTCYDIFYNWKILFVN